MAGLGPQPRAPRLRSQVRAALLPTAPGTSPRLRDERTQAYWKMNQAMHAVRVGAVRGVKATRLDNLVAWSNTYFPTTSHKDQGA